MKIEREKQGSGRARERLANTERLNSLKNVLTMTKTTHLKDLTERLPIERTLKKNVREHVFAFVCICKCMCFPLLFVFSTCEHFGGCFNSKHLTVM